MAALSRNNCILGETLPEACINSTFSKIGNIGKFVQNNSYKFNALTLYSLISSLTELRSSACSLIELIFPLIRLNSYKIPQVKLTKILMKIKGEIRGKIALQALDKTLGKAKERTTIYFKKNEMK